MWHCEAYGPEAAAAGALCFVADLHERVCRDQQQCHQTVAAERARIFQRINERAADGDPVMRYLAEELARPDQILGGDSDTSEDDR
ncbi:MULTISPECIES: hypothetical protein [unclassified Nocardia]|uniref:hypothetical protein n=1 Tax=unclassified Nocardia TaxID=2637762 RepID=UPI00278C07F0|nr:MULTISPECIES: hypothetical protein [unclassified Nocardia]